MPCLPRARLGCEVKGKLKPAYDPIALALMFVAGAGFGWLACRILAALEKETKQ